MKKTTLFRMISIISLFAGTVSMPAQNLYLHYDDGKVLYLGKDNVDSITFSNYDADSVYHEAIVSQVVHTGYEKIHVPISSIVSISCVAQDKSYTTCPDDNHPHMIDLGLPSGTKWACCNVGASSPESFGGYYAWGETSEKDNYSTENYKYYNSRTREHKNIGSDIAGTSYDVAHVKWGSSWRMPSLEQIQELLNNSTSKWTSVNGVNGSEFTGPNGGKVFLPAAGYHEYGHLEDDGCCSYCWSSTLESSFSYNAHILFSSSDRTDWSRDFRRDGHCVRPVSR